MDKVQTRPRRQEIGAPAWLVENRWLEWGQRMLEFLNSMDGREGDPAVVAAYGPEFFAFMELVGGRAWLSSPRAYRPGDIVTFGSGHSDFDGNTGEVLARVLNGDTPPDYARRHLRFQYTYEILID